MFIYLVHIPKDTLELPTHCFYFSCILESLRRGKLFSCMFEDFEASADAPVFEGYEFNKRTLKRIPTHIRRTRRIEILRSSRMSLFVVTCDHVNTSTYESPLKGRRTCFAICIISSIWVSNDRGGNCAIVNRVFARA